jgi:hypothetical protein
MPAGERGLVGRKLEHDIAAAAHARNCLELAAPHQETAPVFGKSGAVGGNVVLVGVGVANIDPGDPVTLWHARILLLSVL